MTDYRLYFMDPRSGHFSGCAEFEAAGDAAAIADAERRRGAGPVELWAGPRKISRLGPPLPG